ncbi:MAG: NADH-quinone oxidoreductase subunit J [Isosphaerales bacterium]
MTIGDAILATLVVVLGAAGTFLMLPHRHGTARPQREYGAGAISASLGLLVFLSFWSPPGPVLPTVFFYVFSVAALCGGLLTVTSRNPIYSALWFAAVVLATAGLFLLAGAPFLAAGTVIVYAGAIIVTFLFVIMLAQMEGKALYDRAARSPGPATFTCFLLLWSLIYALSALKTQSTDTTPNRRPQLSAEKTLYRGRDIYDAFHMENVKAYGTVLNSTLPSTLLIRDSKRAEKPNVAGLGESLYTVHLITVGLAGVLLFVALVGAVAITNPRRPDRV